MGRNNADFHGVSVDYSRLPTEHQITVTHGVDKERIGSLRWSDVPSGKLEAGEITDIWVHPEHRRKGLATRMFTYAKKLAPMKYAPTPILSKEMTEDGKKWAKKVGN
jgi:ribosomal protein S18 acetylase RimI-like enzyme